MINSTIREIVILRRFKLAIYNDFPLSVFPVIVAKRNSPLQVASEQKKASPPLDN